MSFGVLKGQLTKYKYATTEVQIRTVGGKQRGHVHMMSALRGGVGYPKADDSTDKFRECSDKGGDGPKNRKFCGRHMYMPPNGKWNRISDT